MKKLFNINTILIGGVVIVALVMMIVKNTTGVKGGVAQAHIRQTEEIIEISLTEDKIHIITDGVLKVTLEVKDGRIRFIDSICPDHLCEGYGYISMEDDMAVCMPAGVAVIVEKRN